MSAADSPSSAAGQQAHCPRCGAPFLCNAEGPGPCQCQGVTLAPDVLASIRERWTGCLCLACLREIKAQHSTVG